MWKLFKKKKTRFPCYNHFDDLKNCYQQKCAQLAITPHLKVLQKLKKARIKSRVSLRDLNLDDRHVLPFLEVLMLQWPGEQWKTLILKGNQITDHSCIFLARLIEKHTIIEKLDLSSNQLTVDGVKLIHEAVLRRRSKLVLNLAKNDALSRIDVKTYVLACRDLKQAHDVHPNLDTEPRLTELPDEESTMEDDLTSFSPNTDTQHSPSRSTHKDDLDSSREVNEIQNDDSFITTADAGTTDTHVTTLTNVTTDLATGGFSPQLSGQKSVDLSGASDISRIQPAQASPLTRAAIGGGSSPQSQRIVSPNASTRASSQLVTNRGTSSSPRKAASNSRATTPRAGTPNKGSASTPRSPTPTPRSLRNALTRRSTTPRSARNNSPKASKRSSGRFAASDVQQAFVPEIQEVPQIEVPEPQLQQQQGSSTPREHVSTPTPATTKPTLQQQQLTHQSIQQQSPRETQHSATLSASSQKVHLSPRNNIQLPQHPSEPSLAYSPSTPVNRAHTPVVVSDTSSVPSTPDGLISPLRDPNHCEDSPIELHAVSREISELSGIDHRNMEEDVSYDGFDDDVVTDEEDEELQEVENILNSALENHEMQLAIEQRREVKRREREQAQQQQQQRRWIQPNIYKYKKLKEKKQRIEQQKQEGEQSNLPPPPKKKVLKRVRVNPEARSKYLQRMFVLQYEHKRLPDGHFQYETPTEMHVWRDIADADDSNADGDANAVVQNTDAPFSHDERQSLPSPIMLPGDDNDDAQESAHSAHVDPSTQAVLPQIDALPEPLVAISLRAANIAPTVPFESIFPEHSFHTLQCIDLSFNGLTSLTESFQYFPNLRVLSLRGNQLSSLAGLENNIGLEQLDVAGNMLESAEYLEYMQNLQVLDISYNRIETAAGFRMLTMNKVLTILNVEGNPAHVRNYTELRITLTTLLKDSLKIYNNEPSPFYKFKKRMEKRNAKLEAIRKKQQPFLPSSPNAKVDLSRRISIQERYAKDAEEKRRRKLEMEQQEAQKRKEKRKKQHESRKKFYTKVKWQQLNTIPRLETPRYRSTDELNHQLNASLRHSSSVLESILEHASPRNVSIPRSLRSPRRAGGVGSSLTRSERLFQSISNDVAELQQNPPNDEDSTTNAAQLMEVKDDLSATFMAFSTLSQYMERDAHHSEILELRKLLEDCSLFEPLYLGTNVQSPTIQEYVKRANRTKEKLRVLFDSYDRDKAEESGISVLSENGASTLLSPRGVNAMSIHGSGLDNNLSNSMGSAQKQFFDVATKLEHVEQQKKINVQMPQIHSAEHSEDE